MLSTHVSSILTKVSVPTEDIKHALKGPLMPLVDQHLRAKSCHQVLQATHKQSKSS
jgi:hypothetical protein